jgi:sarcosine oxidase
MAPRGSRTGHHHKPDFLGRTIAFAQRQGIAHEVLDAAAIAARFPGFVLSGQEEGCLESGGGFVRPERCIAAQLVAAENLGARILRGLAVTDVRPDGAGVVVETAAGPIRAGHAVVAAGAWAGPLLGPPFDRLLVPYRQVLHWFSVAPAARAAAAALPAFIWMHGDAPGDYFYGFPAIDGAAEVKLATEDYTAPCTPDALARGVTPAETAAIAASVGPRLRGVAPRPVRAVACLYTVTPDAGFVIDRHPGCDRITVISACSGHGFKHSAGIGEAVAAWLATGRSAVDLAPFRLGRFQG